MLSCEYWEQLFYRTPPVPASEGLHLGLFPGNFSDRGKLYQQLELEYLNQKRWWDVYVSFMILLNVQYIKFSKNSFRHSDLTYLLAEQNYKEMKKTSGLAKMSMNRK